ncbi:MAG: hypothetical protein KDA42_05975 [Planctomycetales bacterium]|nr:hypothetical protein [Planctomycetales bacterium]
MSSRSSLSDGLQQVISVRESHLPVDARRLIPRRLTMMGYGIYLMIPYLVVKTFVTLSGFASVAAAGIYGALAGIAFCGGLGLCAMHCLTASPGECFVLTRQQRRSPTASVGFRFCFPQFTLRGVLSFVTAFGVVLSLVGARWRAIRSERDSLAAFRPCVIQSSLGPSGRVSLVSLQGLAWGGRPQRHAALAQLTGLETLILDATGLNDDSVQVVGRLPRLRNLTLRNVAVTDEGLRRVESLPQLKRLVLTQIPLTDRSVSTLTQCQGLYLLILEDTRISPDGIDAIRESLPRCTVKQVEFDF